MANKKIELKNFNQEFYDMTDDGSLYVPCVPLNGIVVFPGFATTFEISDSDVIKNCRVAHRQNDDVFVITKKEMNSSGLPSRHSFYEIGCLGKVDSVEDLENGYAKITFTGSVRAILTPKNFLIDGFVYVMPVIEENASRELEVRDEVNIASAKKYYKEMTRLIPHFPKNIKDDVLSEKNLSVMIDKMAFSAFVAYPHKENILEEADVYKRLEKLIELMIEELEFLYNEMDIHKKVKTRIETNQREYYLKEQLKVIKEELDDISQTPSSPFSNGIDVDDDDEVAEYGRKVLEGKFPEEVEEKLLKEVSKLSKTPYSSAESTVLRNYLDICLEIPWSKKTVDKTDVARAQAQLDKDHYGLEKVKERILEYIAVRQLNPEIKNQIICLVGAPGVGKTSVASSIAKAMGRKYVRVSLGGVKDESDIRGHRKTYVASMPGRIVNALIQAGVNNPLILLDEIDKMSNDHRGDPASAMLEVLDSEQNKSFRDHFVEIPVDLSDCMFIATANSLEGVAKPLIDRMEIIELPIYNRREKLEIAKGYLYPKQLKRHGLTKRQLKIDEKVFYDLADFYTHEAGVRNLERQIAGICRKAAKKIADGETSVKVGVKNLTEFAGQRKILPDKIYDIDEVGTVNGLAYTELGGEMLRVEAVALDGDGKAKFTGSLGDVMKESAQIAVSYIRAHASELGIDPEFYKKKDIHIHFPEGAVPKDGPSAGVALACAITSELGGYPARRDVAMTGEITLHGRVLPIGGLKEKTMAAYKAGAKTVLVPEANKKDIPDLDLTVRENLNFVFCKTLDDAFRNVLIIPE
ncbi:MAG: endopeptidase La [Ruminococcaceae bacterium]|nr:endopeptidase La [Oscillospiraceae bacterium]